MRACSSGAMSGPVSLTRIQTGPFSTPALIEDGPLRRSILGCIADEVADSLSQSVTVYFQRGQIGGYHNFPVQALVPCGCPAGRQQARQPVAQGTRLAVQLQGAKHLVMQLGQVIQ